MSAEIVSSAKYAVQKYRRLLVAREEAARLHVTQCELSTAKRAERAAETFFTCAMQELCAEFPEDGDDAPSPCEEVPRED